MNANIKSKIQTALAATLALCVLPATVLSADAPAARAVIHLGNGGFASGELCASKRPDSLRWQVPSFVAPFDFPLKEVDAVYYPSPANPPKAAGEYCFELAGGDVLFGSLLEWGTDEVVLDVPPNGPLHVRRGSIQQFEHWRNGADVVYRGPTGLDDWVALPSTNAWRVDRGQLVTDEHGASLQSNFALPPRSEIQLELSWSNTPDFVLAMGIGPDEDSVRQAFHIEAWHDDLVVLRETKRDADIASLQEISRGSGRARMQIDLDQEAGRCLVYSSSGKLLADLKSAGNASRPLPGLRLTNKRGDVRLERLQVSRWPGVPRRSDGTPDKIALDKPRLCLFDGTFQYGNLVGYDPAAKSFLLRGDKDAHIPADQVKSAVLSQPIEDASRAITVGTQNSSRISGRLLKVDTHAIWIASPGVREPLNVPLAELRSLVITHDELTPATAEPAGVRGTYSSDGVRLIGHLVDGQRAAGASCLVWQPDASTTASALRADAAGRIVYREPPAAQQIRERETPGFGGGVRGMVIVNGQARVKRRVRPAEPPHELKRKALYLVTGDTIPCEVTRIDQTGVSFTSPLSTSTFVSHDKIKAVELTLDGRGDVALTRTKRERLLTLPRMQKGNPPTQLVRSRDGDYLRGRILEMDDRTLRIEVRLEAREVPRDRISRIIWLHPDDPKAPAHASKVTAAATATCVQAVCSDGIRLTFHPEQLADSTLSGTSDVLGTCRVALDSTDELLLGSAIDEAATRAAYQQWKLQYAIEPKFVQDENKAGSASGDGTESSLVGKPAPDFELDLLGGEHFHLAAHRGKIIVLDFWATWCGNCLQAMPEIVKLHHESGGSDMEVVAVNLEEPPDQITATLERHKWQLPVALDRDGAVAARYGVTAIPQTVIVNRDGSVARHYIGNGPDLSNLGETIKGLKPGAPPKDAAKAAPAATTPPAQ